MAVSSTGTATGTEVASQNYDTRPLTDSELEEVALGLSPELFRVGILLGLSAPWLQEVIADSNRENFGKCMEVLMEWRKTIFVEQERYINSGFTGLCKYLASVCVGCNWLWLSKGLVSGGCLSSWSLKVSTCMIQYDTMLLSY